jgi:uncharacterized protein (TIGR02145 family)/uncharacterized repeat protein (TIGR02543 family)
MSAKPVRQTRKQTKALLVGQWEEVGFCGTTSGVPTMEFLKNGNVAVKESGETVVVGKWKLSADNRLVLTGKEEESSHSIAEISESMFILGGEGQLQMFARPGFKPSITDSRDGTKYRVIYVHNTGSFSVQYIGTLWMAENLNFEAGISRCLGNNEINCQRFGRLYDLTTAMQACPAGWRLPTEEDWQDLIVSAYGHDPAVYSLMSKSGWRNGCGDDTHGFSALPGGGYSSRPVEGGECGLWWIAEGGGGQTSGMWMCGRGVLSRFCAMDSRPAQRRDLMSVRCVKSFDMSKSTFTATSPDGETKTFVRRGQKQRGGNMSTKFRLKIEANPRGGGSVVPRGKIRYSVGTEATVTATPKADYVFIGWSGASTATSRTVTITMNSNQTLTANFERYATFRDSRDSKSYRMVKIGDQVWMAENLNFNASGSVCYDNNDANCAKYGRLYDWNTAMTACPVGWRLPSDEEWGTLVNAVGTNPGTKLKSRTGWHNNGNGTDDFGFSVLPGGYGNGGSFSNVGSWGYWWSASQLDASHARNRHTHWNLSDVHGDRHNKTRQFSVRCLQDVRP